MLQHAPGSGSVTCTFAGHFASCWIGNLTYLHDCGLMSKNDRTSIIIKPILQPFSPYIQCEPVKLFEPSMINPTEIQADQSSMFT